MEWQHDVCIKHSSEQHAQSLIPKWQWISNKSNPEKAKANLNSGPTLGAYMKGIVVYHKSFYEI